MGTFLTILIAYVAMVFGFQYANAVAPLVGLIVSHTDLPTQQVVGFIVLSALFFGIAQIIRIKLFPRLGSSGCIGNILLVFLAIWVFWILFAKIYVYCNPVTAFDSIKGTSSPEEWGKTLSTLIWSETTFDNLIQFWFPSGEKYFLFSIFMGA